MDVFGRKQIRVSAFSFSRLFPDVVVRLDGFAFGDVGACVMGAGGVLSFVYEMGMPEKNMYRSLVGCLHQIDEVATHTFHALPAHLSHPNTFQTGLPSILPTTRLFFSKKYPLTIGCLCTPSRQGMAALARFRLVIISDLKVSHCHKCQKGNSQSSEDLEIRHPVL